MLAGFQQSGFCDVVAGVQSDEMALMAVLRVPVVPVVIPLVEVAFVSDGVWMQSAERLLV